MLRRLLVLCCLLALPMAARAETRVALVIGNAAYVSGGTLANPVNDARAVAKSLRSLGFEVTVLENVGLRAMTRGISQFGQRLRPDGVALFYYAGHGMQVRGRNFLIPVDAEITSESSAISESVDVDSVMQQLSANTRLNLIILDACRNNPFERAVRSGAGAGLAAIDAPTGTLIAYATAPGKTARDGAAGGNGLYTSKLLDAMAVPGIKVEDVFKRVRINVAHATRNEQVPWEASSLIGDFYFTAPAMASVDPGDGFSGVSGGGGALPSGGGGGGGGAKVAQIGLGPVPSKEDLSGKRLRFQVVRAGRGRYLLIAGPITPGDYRTTVAALEEAGPVDGVLLDSGGGVIEEAMEIGRLLRARKLATRVPSGAKCASACNFVLMGGVIRQVDPDAVFEVHLSTASGNAALVDVVQKVIKEQGGEGAKAVIQSTEQHTAITAARVARYLVEMSVSLRYLTLFADTPNAEPVRLTNDKLRDLNVINVD
ncbi:caspase family protein [Azospirillum sp. TSO22-1]|uniref:caspase family protein n=1 Tax=Azospirillum sp. TSO22-1 TaxID=716789 RepID=UPI001304920C|nr:caspase family protein [Azospirillum sp. TSO22-1]